MILDETSQESGSPAKTKYQTIKKGFENFFESSEFKSDISSRLILKLGSDKDPVSPFNMDNLFRITLLKSEVSEEIKEFSSMDKTPDKIGNFPFFMKDN